MSLEATIARRIHAFFDAMHTQDLHRMERLVAHDAEMVHIGTDAGEVWRGWDELHAATGEQFETLEAYEADVYDLAVSLGPSGDVAWYAHRLDARITSNGTTTVWEGARFTGVFVHRDDRWQMAQTHVSLPG